MEKDSPTISWLKVSELILGEVIMAFGLVAVVGSYTVDMNLLEVVAPFLPTEYNAALGFILCGLGLLAIGFGSARVAIASGLAGLIGLVVVYFGIGLPITELQDDGASPLSGSVLIIGLLAAFLLALAVHLAQTVWLYGKQTKAANEKLENEIRERNRTEERVQHNVERIRALHDIGQAIISSLELGAVLDILIDKIGSLLPNLVTEVRLLNRESRQLERIACGNLDKEEWMRRMLEKTSPLLKAVLEKKASVLVSNVQTDLRILDPEFFRKHGLVSYLGVPLVAKGEILGVISFITREEHQFSKEESEFLTTLAGEAAIAIHKSQLYEQVERRSYELSALYSIASVVNQSLDVDVVLRNVSHKVLEIFEFDAARIYLLDKNGKELCLLAHEGFPKDIILPSSYQPGEGLIGRVFKTGESILFEDIQSDPEFLRQASRKILLKAGFRGLICIPIKVKGKTVGVMNFCSKNAHQISSTESQLIQSIADHLGTAVENATLYEESRRREEIQGLLKELSQDITSLDIESLLKKLTGKVREILKVDISDMRTLEEGKLRVRGVSGTDPNLLISTHTGTRRGRAGWIMEHRQPLMIADTTQEQGIASGETIKRLGIRGYLGVPLFSKNGEVFGALRALSYQPREFTQGEIDLLQQMANGAAIALENARLFEQTKEQAAELAKDIARRKQAEEVLHRSEETARQLANENTVLAEIGRIISSSLDIDGVYKSFAEQVRRLIPFDRLVVRTINLEQGTLATAYAEGVDVSGWRLGKDRPVAGTSTETLIRTRSGLILEAESDEELVRQFPNESESIKAGLRSLVAAPLISNNKVIGAVNFRSFRPNAYTERDLKLAESVGAQIAGAIANSQLYAQHKRVEKGLKTSAARLQRSNRELQNFLYVGSHDLQEPLRKVQAFGDRLKNKCGDSLGDEGAGYLERMQNAAGRMKALINDLLTFSRVTTEAQPFVAVDLAEVTQGVLSDLEVRIQQTGGRVEVGDLPTVDADPLQMRKLLQNLIGNALKFHRKEQTPVVKVHGQLLNGQAEHAAGTPPVDGLCQITVEDNGVGFDEKYLDRIFNVFQRLHGRGDYEGSGIGLAVCRKIAERHGGGITAESKPGNGATFIVKLPIRQLEGGEEV